MARYVTSARTTAGSTTLPIISLYSAAAVRPRVREIGVFNTTAVAASLAVQRFTTAGTAGAGLTEAKFDPDAPAASCTAFNTHTVAPTLGDALKNRVDFAASLGAYFIWDFPEGLIVPVGVANGVGIVPAGATGQISDAYFVWNEESE